MPNTLEQSLELLMDMRKELDLLFPKTKLSEDDENAGTASELIWQHSEN